MRKNLLKMLTCGRAAILTCGLTAVMLSACSSDNDDKTETPQEQTVKMFYVVEVSDDVLKVADVEVNYVDQTGAKQKEVMTSTTWKKTLNAKALPLTEGLWAKLTPKGIVESDSSYIVKVTTSATYEAKLANGQTASGGFGTDPTASLSLVQTPEHVAAWCATSPTIGFAVDKNGNATKTSVDFGGNSDDDGNAVNVSPDAQQGPPALDFTSPSKGQVIGSDGKNYDYASLPSGVTAVAKICYVSGAHGLALALTDERGTMDWSKAQTTCAAHQPAFNGGTWKLASQEEWDAMLNAVRMVSSFREGFSGITGASNLQTGDYWSSTEYNSSEARYYDFYNEHWDYISKAVTVIRVRACLAF